MNKMDKMDKMNKITHIHTTFTDKKGETYWIVSQYKHTRRLCRCTGLYGICYISKASGIKSDILLEKDALKLCSIDKSRIIEKINNIRIRNAKDHIRNVIYQKIKFKYDDEPTWIISNCLS